MKKTLSAEAVEDGQAILSLQWMDSYICREAQHSSAASLTSLVLLEPDWHLQL